MQGYLVSVITQIELLGWKGLDGATERAITELLADVTVIGLNEDVVDKTIELRKATNLRVPDAIVAATALVAGVELVSCDHCFAGVPGLVASAVPLLDAKS